MAEICPDYDPVNGQYGGPCWTCQDGRGPCPLIDPLYRAERTASPIDPFVIDDVRSLSDVVYMIEPTICVHSGMEPSCFGCWRRVLSQLSNYHGGVYRVTFISAAGVPVQWAVWKVSYIFPVPVYD